MRTRVIVDGEIEVSGENRVFLNIYDLSTEWLKANDILAEVLQIGGAFHSGVEVYGREYVYGGEGIYPQDPKSHEVHVYRQSIEMGRTQYSAPQVAEMVEKELSHWWRGEDYHLLTHNCCSFSRAFCFRLVRQRIPPWVDRLAKLAHKNGLEDVLGNVLIMRPESSYAATTCSGSLSDRGDALPIARAADR